MDKNRETDKGQEIVLDRYRLDEVIGEGAFGIVHRAFDTRLKRLVALKSLRRSLATSDPNHYYLLEDRFTREAEAGSRVGSHPNLVTVYDLAVDTDGTRYLVLEYVSSGTLAQHLRNHGHLSLADALHLTGEVARGLHAAHSAGIVHRDVKPANIFLAADGRAQVGDFGIAQIDNLSRRTSVVLGHPGTPLYMSPEQAISTAYIRAVSDEYSLGLVFFELLTGEVYRRIGKREAEAILARQPRPIQAFLARMLAEDPDDRYRSLAAVGTAVAAIERESAAFSMTQPSLLRDDNETEAETPQRLMREPDTPPLPTSDPGMTDAYANIARGAVARPAAPTMDRRDPPSDPLPVMIERADAPARRGWKGIFRRRTALWALPVIAVALIASAFVGVSYLGNGGGQVTATPPPRAATPTDTPAVASVASGSEQYAQGQRLMSQNDFAGAATAFMQAGTYQDAPRQAITARVLADQQDAYDRGIAALDQKDYATAAQAFQDAGQYKDAPRAYAYSSGFIALAGGTYDEATTDFVAAGDFRDAPAQRRIAGERVQNKQAYDAGVAAAGKGDWQEAVKQFTAAGQYEDAPQQLMRAQEELMLATKYNDAQGLLKQNKYAEAYPSLVEIEKVRPTYRDVATILKHLRGDVAGPVTLDIVALNESSDVVGFITPINNLIGQPVAYLRVVRTFSYRSTGSPNVVSGLGVDLIPSGDPNAPKASQATPVFVASDEKTYHDSIQPGEQIALATAGAAFDVAEYGQYTAHFEVKDVATTTNARLPNNQQARYPTFTKLVIVVTFVLR